jgi:hypothetical protein
MRHIKLIIGIGCCILGLYFAFGMLSFLLSGFTSAAAYCAIPAALFCAVGLLLVLKRKGRWSVADKAIMVVLTVLLGCFIIIVLVPDCVAARYTSNQNSCVNNLRQLQAAKEEWSLENGITNGTLVTANDLTPYIQLDSHGQLPKCPDGGTYIFGRVGEDVKCSIGTSDWPYRHVLSDTNYFDRWTSFKEAYATLFGFHNPRKP